MIHRAAVLGSPVSHSLSPALHRAGFAAAGLTDWRYDRIECDGDTLPALVRSSGPEWLGYSVTMPGKAAAAAVSDARSRRVELLGVANTLWRGPNGWHAENTDVDGVLGALQAATIAPPRVLCSRRWGHSTRCHRRTGGARRVRRDRRRPAAGEYGGLRGPGPTAGALGVRHRSTGRKHHFGCCGRRPGGVDPAGRRGRSSGSRVGCRPRPFRRGLPPVADTVGCRLDAATGDRNRAGYAAAPGISTVRAVHRAGGAEIGHESGTAIGERHEPAVADRLRSG